VQSHQRFLNYLLAAALLIIQNDLEKIPVKIRSNQSRL
jgi:hypothetical protein